MEDTLGNHSPTSIKINKKTTNEKIGKHSNAKKLIKEKNQMKKKNTKEKTKTKRTSSDESVNLYRRNTNQNVLDSTRRGSSLRIGRNGKNTRNGNRRMEMKGEKRGKGKKKQTGKPTGKNWGKIKKSESRKSTGEGKALKRARTSKSILIDDISANDKKKKHKTSKFISKTHKAQEAYGTSTAKNQPGEMEKEVEVTHHLSNEIHLIQEEENGKGAHDTVEKEKNLYMEKSFSGGHMVTQWKETTAENQVNADYFNLNSFNKNINDYNSHESIRSTNHPDTYNNSAIANSHSTHNSNNDTIYNNNSNTPNDDNATNFYQRKQSAEEEPQNDALFEHKLMPFEINGTIRKSFLPLFKKEARKFLTEDHSIFKLEKNKSVTLNPFGSSKYYSMGYVRMGNKKKKNGFLKNQNTKEKDTLWSRPQEKKRMSLKEKDTVKSKGNGRTGLTTKMKKNVPKLKKEKTSEFHIDVEKQRSSNLTNRHVHITNDVKILKPPSRNTVTRCGPGGESIEKDMRGQSLDMHRMERHEENEEMEEKGKEEGESDMGENEGTLLTAIKSMRLEWAGGEHREGEEADENETEYREQSSDGKRSSGTNDEKEKYKEGSEHTVLEEQKEKKENAEGNDGIEGQKDHFSDSISKNSHEVDIHSKKQETVDPLKEKVDKILKRYVFHKRKRIIQRRKKYTPFTEPLDIKEQSLQMDTIKFLSDVKEDIYCDDIIFFFDNYEKKIKKQEDLIKGFNKLFKSENFDLEGFQSVLLIFDRIIKKMKRDLATFPVQSLFTHIVREMQKLRVVDLQKRQSDYDMLYKSTNDTHNVFTPNKFAQMYTKNNIIAKSESFITEENKLVEVKIKKLKKYHDADLYNPLNDSSPYKTEHLQFIPYLLRKHWHDQNKLEILRNILNEMERRKKPKHLQITDVNTLQTKWNLWDLICCFNCINSQTNINECDCEVYSQQNIQPDYSAKNCHRYLPFDYVHEIPSHKLSDVIHYMAYN